MAKPADAQGIEIVPVESDIQLAQRLGQLHALVQCFGNPNTTTVDAHHQRIFQFPLIDRLLQLGKTRVNQ